MKKIIPLFIAALVVTLPAAAQHTHSHSHGRLMVFPDIPGYQTLKCDFHIHTVFSDGSVWPNIRVQEALKDGLDAIALTEHLEYQPHQDDIPHPDRNRSYQIALEEAEEHDLLIVHGSEITRSMPPGHSNAIFIQDANRLLQEDALAVFREAKNQGAFIFWNHPNWTAHYKDGIAKLTDLHLQLIEEGLLDGIEVANETTYSDEALQIALDHNLTIMGTSDIHGLVDWQFEVPEGGHRPITLVFAEEKSEQGIKEGLEARRTVAWYNNSLIGNPDVLYPLLEASIQVTSAAYQDDTQVLEVELTNASSATLVLRNQGAYTFHNNAGLVVLEGEHSQTVLIKSGTRMDSLDLEFEVVNALTAPDESPLITINISVE